MYLGGALFAWCSDYAQFYLVDSAAPAIADIESVTPDAMARGVHVAANGLAIYTADCLRQTIAVRLYDAAPADATDIERWTKVVSTMATFPSGRFTLSSPSMTGSEAHGPHFLAPGRETMVRICWREDDDDRYNALRPRPDEIEISIWPA